MNLFLKKTKKRFIFLAEIFSHQGTDHVEAIEKESMDCLANPLYIGKIENEYLM